MSFQGWIMKKIMKISMPMDKDIFVKRKKTDDMCSAFKPAKDIAFERVQVGSVAAEWATPINAPMDKAIIYLHGGGYCIGSIGSYRHFTSALAATSGIKTLSIEYRLAPENPFPAALEDVLYVYDNLLDEGMSADSIIFAGDSAGGGLCLAVAIALRDNGKPLPRALVLLSPWTDLSLSAESYKTKASKDPMCSTEEMINFVNSYKKDHDVKNPLISPMFGSFQGLPPILIHAGTDEMLADDFGNLTEKARTEGVNVTLKIWKGMFHIFTVFYKYTPEGKKSLKEVSEYISKCLNNIDLSKTKIL